MQVSSSQAAACLEVIGWLLQTHCCPISVSHSLVWDGVHWSAFLTSVFSGWYIWSWNRFPGTFGLCSNTSEDDTLTELQGSQFTVGQANSSRIYWSQNLSLWNFWSLHVYSLLLTTALHMPSFDRAENSHLQPFILHNSSLSCYCPLMKLTFIKATLETWGWEHSILHVNHQYYPLP